MASTSSSFWLLALIVVSALLFFSYELMNNDCQSSNCRRDRENLKEVQVKELVGKDANIAGTKNQILKENRVLLGMKTSKSRKPRSERSAYSPAQAPLSYISPRKPLHHHWHRIAPVHSLTQKTENGAKTRHRRLVIVITTSVGAAFIILVSSAIIACTRSRRIKKKSSKTLMPLSSRKHKFQLPSSATSKVSFDPGPELFYLNALTSYLQNDFSLKPKSQIKNVSTNGNISYVESLTTKQISESRNALANESISNAVLSNVEPAKYESDISSETEKLTSEDQISHSESFRSECFSHSLGPFSDASETKFSQNSLNFSPSSLPFQSISSQGITYKLPISREFSSFSPTECREGNKLQNPSLCKIQVEGTPYLISQTTCNIESTDQKNCKCSSGLNCFSVNSSSGEPNLSTEEKTESELTFVCQSTLSISASNTKLAQNVALPPAGGEHIPKPQPRTPNKPPPPPPLLPTKLLLQPLVPAKPPPLPQCPPQPATSKNGTPLLKLKPLHWIKVRATPDHSMVWDRIRSSSFEFDEKMIESLFGYNSQSLARLDEARNKSPSPAKNVMEHKRLQNITILMKALNASTEQVIDALVQGRGLSVQQLEALVKMTPTKEEGEKLSMYEGDINDIDPTEKFLEMVLRIPCAFSRSEVMLYRETFRDEVDHIRKSLEILNESCEELKFSRLFLKLLEAVLKTGNRMNVGTVRGDARAFKLDALLKLADVKGTDGKTTLLHFVVREVIRSEDTKAMQEIKPKNAEEKDEEFTATGLNLVSGLSNELCNVKKTSGIDLNVLMNSVSNLSMGLSQLKQLIEHLSSDSKNDEFVQTMKYFIDSAETTIKELTNEEELVLLHVREITEYYHGSVSREEVNPLRIFVIVRDFLAMLDQACKEIRSTNDGRLLAFFLMNSREKK